MNAQALTEARVSLVAAERLRELVPYADAEAGDDLLEGVRKHAGALLRSTRAGNEAEVSAALAHLAEIVNLLALQAEPGAEAIGTLVDAAAEDAGLEPAFVRLEVAVRALRDPAVLARLPRVAIPAQVRLVAALTGAADVSLYEQTTDGALTALWPPGDDSPEEEARRTKARDALRGGGLDADDDLVSVPVTRGGRAVAALVARTPAGEREAASRLMREAAATLGLVLERESLLRRNEEQERSLVQASERRMVRLGFDLHDGAIQDIAALASDVRLFRDQMGPIVAGHEHEGVLLGRIEDLLSRLYALDADLRRLVRSFETPTTASRPLEEMLHDEVALFRARADIDVALAVVGDFSDLTASQRIALLRVVQEALTNVREHSGAGRVDISVVRRGGYAHAEIRDDGTGFDLEQALTDAARRGRLGLLGMSERVRLLGGMFDVESRPGGPTTILVTLPEWRPPAAERAGTASSRAGGEAPESG